MKPYGRGGRRRVTVEADESDRAENSEATVAAMVAANSPITRRSVFSSNTGPYHRSIRPATMAASLALATAKTIELQTLRSPSRFARMVAAITPRMTGPRAAEPATINAPEATPAAGQNAATPSGFPMRARLSEPTGNKQSRLSPVVTTATAHGGRGGLGAPTVGPIRSDDRAMVDCRYDPVNPTGCLS